jgi:KTSC domain
MPKLDPLTLTRLLKFKWTHGKAIESQCVADVSYDPLDSSMTIQFQQRGTYKYKDVPVDVYVDFETSGSRGQYFNNYIRNTYSYERIE